jgi:hypothetical protein
VIAATMCGTTPRIPPNAATMPALEPRDRPGADGVHRTGAGRGDHHEGGQQEGNAHRSNLPVRARLRHTLLAVFGTLAEWDAAVVKGAGSAERPATRRDRACAASGPACGHHRFYAAVLSPRPRAVVARARYLAMLVAATRLRASECRAENRAIAVALMITGFRRWVCGRPTGPTEQEV